jgi:hypothetical protein
MDNENTMNITSATFVVPYEGEQTTTIQVVIDGQQISVPMDPHNRHYKEILRQTKAKTLVIENPS